MSRAHCWLFWLILPMLLLGCRKETPSDTTNKPASTAEVRFGAPRTVAPDTLMREATLNQTGVPCRVRLYLPVKMPRNKLPVVMIAPAGTRLFHGNSLGGGDQAEHLPYVRAGYAVVAYELDGDLRENATDAEVLLALTKFRAAEAGIKNAKNALDFALTNEPALDANRIYAAGHSSAGTVALLLAEKEPRIKACLAYAPCCDVEARLKETVPVFTPVVPDYTTFLHASSPLTYVTSLRCPVFLFHADDDSNVPLSDNAAFVSRLKKTNANVTFVRVPTGNHYDSMIR